MSGPSRPTGKKPSGVPGGPSRPTGKKPSGVPGDQRLVTITEEYKDLFKYSLENHVRDKKGLEEITNKIIKEIVLEFEYSKKIVMKTQKILTSLVLF